jgi:protein-arginine kinase activator protein McsA
VKASCSRCATDREIAEKSLRKNIKRNGSFVCQVCAYKTRPQNTKAFWEDPALRDKVRQSMITSEAFKESRKVVSEKLKGAGNPQFGKSPSDETRSKMSKTRTGKRGKDATAWKGGKSSLNSLVKKQINRDHQWSKKIFERDGWVCASCPSKLKLDAHHVIPFATLLKEVLSQTQENQADLIGWLSNHPVLKDAQGITLCRECHRKVHQNWGSHKPKVQND